ncbi:MAG: D-isomer specific 2-hydroxyacid dehydrogenase family protein [Propionibacteriaceae bacterium]
MPDLTRIHLGPQPDPTLTSAITVAGAELVDLDQAEAVVWVGGPGDFPKLPDAVRWVQLGSAGVESWFAAGVIDDRRIWTSATGAYGPTVAEHTVALLLAGVRALQEQIRATRWDRDEIEPHVGTLRGATVAIVGAGGIGRAMVSMLTALGADVLAVNRSGRQVPGAIETWTSDRTAEVWGRADHVVIAAPATSDTAHLVGTEQLAAMKPTAWLVNIARGSLVDSDALVAALASGQIAGAALDVTDPEPLPDGHPLWDLPNAIITPHVANPTAVQGPLLAEHIAGNVRRFVAGEALESVIDRGRGY